jgi:hypothetical protein
MNGGGFMQQLYYDLANREKFLPHLLDENRPST